MSKSLVDTIKDLYERKIEVSEPEEKKLKKIVKSLHKSVKAHGDQAKSIEKSIIDKQTVSEAGHDDVKSAKNQVKIAMSALEKMNTELSKLKDEDSLPTWWTNKVAIAVDKLDGMADYLDTQVESKEVNELSKDTLRSYMKKASDAQKYKGLPISKVDKRYSGVHKADKKINKDEEVNEIAPMVVPIARAVAPTVAKAVVKKMMNKDKEEGFGPRSRGRKVGSYPKPKMPKVNEISTDTKKMYVQRATKDIADKGIDLGLNLAKDNPKPSKTAMDKILKRRKGITKAVKSMTKNERKLTEPELKGREKVAKDLPDAEFKKRYGDNWMAVKMATATNIAKKKY